MQWWRDYDSIHKLSCTNNFFYDINVLLTFLDNSMDNFARKYIISTV